MAHLITGYAGYEHIQSADEGAFNASFFGDKQYVMQSGNEFNGSIIDNNTVRILDGDGLMYGRHFRIDKNSYEDVTIITGTAGKKRIDLICMTYEKMPDDETEIAYLQVIKGTESEGTPQVPYYTDGNILEGATFNQMPLYKVTIEGVVLSKIEPMFETLPTYQKLAQIYAERFETICEQLRAEFDLNNVLKLADVVNNLTSTETNKPLSANQGKVLNDKFSSYVAKSDIVTTRSSDARDKALSAAMGKYLNDDIEAMADRLENEVVYYADVVNNLESTATNLPLSAAQGMYLAEDVDLLFDNFNSIYNDYISKSKIVNNLTSTSTTSVLSAYQGKLLNDKSVKYKDVTLSNVAITTKSAYGAYYSDGAAMSGLVSSNVILSILVIGWNHAIASFNPYFQDGKIRFLSDVSQTVSSIVVRVAYI